MHGATLVSKRYSANIYSMKSRKKSGGTRKRLIMMPDTSSIPASNTPTDSVLIKDIKIDESENTDEGINIENDTDNYGYDEDTIENYNITETLSKEENNERMIIEREEYIRNTDIDPDDKYRLLYPEINDPNFSVKIASRKEFFDTQYDGTIYDIKEQSDKVCKAKFELMPHQLFVKNFLSFQTPYNSLFLYHELGTGKTCSAIGIAEEMRKYLKDVGIKQKIIIVANPNVQNNFRMQLFDEKKLTIEDNIWNIQSCLGNTLLNEINPTRIAGLSREQIISKIRSLINRYYSFKGYIEFANNIQRTTSIDDKLSPENRLKLKIKSIRQEYNNRLIIIDEVHNLRSIDDTKYKLTLSHLLDVVKYAENMRLLLLSATPMYDSYKEIIWITNIMNLNDRRSQLRVSDVFNIDGDFKAGNVLPDGTVEESGRELLHRKLTGYVSYVRGENPYSFPYRIYPYIFSPKNTFLNGDIVRPTIKFNGVIITSPLEKINVYLTEIGEYQEKIYKSIISTLNISGDIDEVYNKAGSMGQKLLMYPLQALTMIFPVSEIDDEIIGNISSNTGNRVNVLDSLGRTGISRTMSFVDNTSKMPPEKYDFDYTSETLSRYGRIFQRNLIHKYSSKIHSLCESLYKSKGIVLVYAFFIDFGIIPICLALEEMGMSRFSVENVKPLFTRSRMSDVKQIDARTMTSTPPKGLALVPAKYAVISGDRWLSPNNADDIKHITDPLNKDGETVKVVIISIAGAEGLDFKNIRQIHIIDAWFNMNRIQQIIGRGVRNLSHCALPFEERNVEIYLHATLLRNASLEEAVDLYVYRMAEKKAVQSGKVTRLLKEVSVDCLLNIGQTNFTVDKLNSLAANQTITMNLSSGETIPYKVGDRPFSEGCDYLEECAYSSPNVMISPDNIIAHTYNTEYIKSNNDTIIQRIKILFKDRNFYRRDQLLNSINISRQYPIEQIYFSLTYLINNKTEYLIDKYGRSGNLENKGEYYIFRPIEITDDRASIFERNTPVDYKRTELLLEIPSDIVAINPNNALDTPEKIIDFDYVVDNISSNINALLSSKKCSQRQNKWSWYQHLNCIRKFIESTHNISENTLILYSIYHALDVLSLEMKLILITHIYIDNWIPTTTIEGNILQYFNLIIMNVGSRRGIMISNKNNIPELYILTNGIWALGNFTDYDEDPRGSSTPYNFGTAIIASRPNYRNLSKYLGFFSYFKNNTIIFYLKNIEKISTWQSPGSRADQAGKDAIMGIINEVQTDLVYTRTITESISQVGLCCILELIMRHTTIIRPEDPIMFLSLERAYSIKDNIKI
jgi:hypothetical protein